MYEYRTIPLQTILNENNLVKAHEVIMLNEYEIAFALGSALGGLLLLAVALTWVGQWAWAWIDEQKEIGNNPILSFLSVKRVVKGRYSEYIYPVYAYHDEKERERRIKDGDVRVYSKYKEDSGSSYWHVCSSRCKHPSNIEPDTTALQCIIHLVFFGLIALPLTCLILFKVYPLTLAAISFLLLAFLARYVRRIHKSFKKHVIDPAAHKEAED